ncbi:MAG: PH domain-containing protein, partial [Parasphingorhabdus sp.]
LIWLLLTAVAVGNGLFVHIGLYAIILLAIPVSWIQFLNWRHHQYALTDSQLYVRSGWWRRKLTILPLPKVQTVDISQTPFDHPLDLATVTIGIAGGSSMTPLTIAAIPFHNALNLRNALFAQQNQT